MLLWREDGGQAKQQAALLLSGPDIRPGDGGPLAPLPRLPGPRHSVLSPGCGCGAGYAELVGGDDGMRGQVRPADRGAVTLAASSLTNRHSPGRHRQPQSPVFGNFLRLSCRPAHFPRPAHHARSPGWDVGAVGSAWPGIGQTVLGVLTRSLAFRFSYLQFCIL